MVQKTPRRRTGYVYNDATSRSTLASVPATPHPPKDAVKETGTIRAQLIGKLGARGYGRLLAKMRDTVRHEVGQ